MRHVRSQEHLPESRPIFAESSTFKKIGFCPDRPIEQSPNFASLLERRQRSSERECNQADAPVQNSILFDNLIADKTGSCSLRV